MAQASYLDCFDMPLIDWCQPLQNKTDLEDSLRQFTLPERKPNRYCKSKFGVIAKDWISKAVQDVTQQNMSLPKGSALALSLRYIDNDTPQKSVVLRLLPPNADSKPGNTIVVGAHMDSVNHQRPQNQSDDSMIAPGADDNASGSIVLLNVVKALARVFEKKPMTNEVQFHWYGAEEIGLHGSKSVFSHMRNQSYNVKAMLNLDMVGYAGAHESGSPKIALQEGFVNRNLTAFMAKLVQTVSFQSVGRRAVMRAIRILTRLASIPMRSLDTQAVAIHARITRLRTKLDSHPP